MTKIYDEDVQYKEEVKFLDDVVVAVLRAKALDVLDVGTGVAAYTLESGQAGLAVLVPGTDTCTVTLPAAASGRHFSFVVYGTDNVVTLAAAASDQLVTSSDGTTASTLALDPWTQYSVLAVDDASWAVV